MEQLELIEALESEEAAADHFSRPSIAKGYTSLSGIVILIASTIITGIIYVVLQWFRQENVQDALFISMLIGATMILVYGVSYLSKYIVNKGLNFCIYLLSRSKEKEGYREYDRLCRSVINFRRMTISGILYGLVIGSAPFILGVWNDDIVLKISLSIFMFFVNFTTGIAFYGLIMFFVQSIKMGRLVNINLWQVNNPSTDFFMGATRRFSIITSIYVSICLSSVLFSLLPIGGLMIAYSCFSGLTIMASVFIPPLPIVRKLKEAKTRSLFQIDKQLHLSFHINLDDIKPNRPDVDFEKVKTLLELREKVEAIHTWPFRIKSILTAVSVIFFSSIPVIIQIILEVMFE